MNDGFTRKQQLTHINVLMEDSGLGDMIARLPALNYLHVNFPHLVIHVWIPVFSKEIVERTLPKSDRLIIRTFDKRKRYNKTLPTRSFKFTHYNNLSQHMTKHAFHQIVNIEPKDEDMNYLPIKVDDISIDKFNLPKKYIVMPLGFTSHVREFLPEHVNPVIDYIKSKGYEVVFLGSSKKDEDIENVKGYFREEIHWHKGINLIDKTTLLEATKIIYGATLVLGIDCGILHLAATHPQIPIIGGFTTVHSSGRLPYRFGIKGYNYFNIDLDLKKVSCGNCQTRLPLTFSHNFTLCYEAPQAKSNKIKCLTYFTPDKWINELEKIL